MVDDALAIAAEIGDVAVAVGADALGEVGGGDAGDRRLAGGVDVHHDQHVRLVEGGPELLEQVRGARVAVRLERRHDPAVEPCLGGGQGGADLDGMVAVVVDDGDAIDRAPYLEAALHARERGQRLADRHERDLEVEPDADGGQRVEDVVRSEEHTSELQSQSNLVCRLLLEKKKKSNTRNPTDNI